VIAIKKLTCTRSVFKKILNSASCRIFHPIAGAHPILVLLITLLRLVARQSRGIFTNKPSPWARRLYILICKTYFVAHPIARNKATVVVGERDSLGSRRMKIFFSLSSRPGLNGTLPPFILPPLSLSLSLCPSARLFPWTATPARLRDTHIARNCLAGLATIIQ
jgi:hypothetical protein